MEQEKGEGVIYSQNVTDFVTVVSEYCLFVENTF